MTDATRRLTYLMLFRVGVVTFLLVTVFFSELAAPKEAPTSPRITTLLALIAATYGLTIFYALWLRRPAVVQRTHALVQVGMDLVLTTLLVHYTGGIESGFLFMYLLLIAGSGFVLGGLAIGVAAASVVMFGGLVAIRRVGVVPSWSQMSVISLAETLRATGVNAVAFAATGMLSARLAVELRRAGERAESQGERLRDLATMHQDVIRCLTSGLITLTSEGVVITYNAAAAEILDVPPERAVGRRIGEIIPSLEPLLAQAPTGGRLSRGEIVHRLGGGERTLGVSLSPLVDSAGRVLGRIVNFQDLTELRRMEDVVERSERLAAVGRLAAGVAHEIRNPLAAISGSVELLAKLGGGAQGDTAALTDIVLREAARLNALITDLLDFARPRAPERQPIDLSQALADLVRVFENDKEIGAAGIELDAPGKVTVSADASQLRQVVWNLVRNAAQASPPDTPIAIRVQAQNGHAELTVRDRGPGIPADQRDRVFEPFFSTKKGGTGLGLAVVHRIVEEHGGRIYIQSPDGGGTAMVVRLPLLQEVVQ